MWVLVAAQTTAVGDHIDVDGRSKCYNRAKAGGMDKGRQGHVCLRSVGTVEQASASDCT